MATGKDCTFVTDDYQSYIVEYRGDFEKQIKNLNYACGNILNDTLAVIQVEEKNLNRLLKDVPSINFLEMKTPYVLQDISPGDVDTISEIKLNPYLNLNGNGVVVGMIDSGIDYLNPAFINADDTSRIVAIWDQTGEIALENTYIGVIYERDQINEAIKAYRNNEDPYAIVKERDDIYHGSKMASIIGASKNDTELIGIAPNCEFLVVKLKTSKKYEDDLRANGIQNVPVYDEVEVITAIDFLKLYSERLGKPLVIYLGVGTTLGSHAGNSIISRYLNTIAYNNRVAIVTGVGNEGDSDGHVSGSIKNTGDTKTIELNIPKEMDNLEFSIWVDKPDILSLEVLTPRGETSNFIQAKIFRDETIRFILSDSSVRIRYYVPGTFTGQEVIFLNFKNIKPGIWKLVLRGDYVTSGKFNIWLPPKIMLPEDLKFLEPDSSNTLTIPSTARNVISVAYYNSERNTVVAQSGNGYDERVDFKPDIATAGINVLAISKNNRKEPVSGSSVATAITAGCCALIMQWGIVDKKNTNLFNSVIKSYLIYGADREPNVRYPNRYNGYGLINMLKTFEIIAGIFRTRKSENFIEYYNNRLFIRIPKEISIQGVRDI